MSDPYQPYGAPYGEQPPPGYGYGPGYPPPHQPRNDGLRTSAIVALVLNLIAIVTCCNFVAIAGAIMAGLGLGKVDTEPENARSKLVWAWVLFGAGFLVTIGGFLFLGFAGYLDDNG
ncbi:hypothetical protein [Nonomuraea endophytica]|uniref:Cytochrome c biogenesis protein CcdA n=1 Tax=Nonomuraea endophytica TaxID=714136 RepID=A0A7W8ADN1_9ACTN|nr:hypothetical protein [Nonomuraea endophytica]MBB5083151.1 cytochrome c biogenesis protein CcdA [Nonomuraea endophytica]